MLLIAAITSVVVAGCRRDSKASVATATGDGHTGSTLQSAADFPAILSANPHVLVDFYADWCPPCRALKPTIQQLADEYRGKVTVVAVDVDKFGDLAAKYQISAIPVVILFERGQVAEQYVGLQPKSAYVSGLEKMLAN